VKAGSAFFQARAMQSGKGFNMSPVPQTREPHYSDATINFIRAAAHRYVRAGGGIVTDRDGRSVDDATAYIGDIQAQLFPTVDEERLEKMLKGLGLPFSVYDPLLSAAGCDANYRQDAAFLFGTFVGLELAALAAPFTQSTEMPAKKGRQ